MIAITGASGNIGGGVARLLAGQGIPLRLLARDRSRLPQLPGTDAYQAEYSDRQAMEEALQGVSTMLLVSGRESQDRLAHHQSAIDAAVAAGVETVVYTSFAGAAPEATFTLARQHWFTEEHLRRSGMAPVILRNNLYLDVIPYFPGPDGIIRGPAADGRLAAVAREDVIEVAAACLLDPAHRGAVYHLTGPESFSFGEAAAILSEFSGRNIGYYPETVEEAYRSRAVYNAPQFEVEGWVTSYLAVATGELAEVSDDVAVVTSHRPVSLREFLHRHPEAWQHLTGEAGKSRG
ncbi:MAG TPA: SDR family oxidoreductase [Acidimicrobiia bacterium]|nr:SDR family oxidoreductase [Acidimicrobiia bacterium]